ncbi:DUF2291 family protein [Streptosporangium sp. NPDC002721]|uniref:DUF2291 family protein n=1 Tax=Streptosporangium sp. NPDC002721 TaxID=3366188 RepID=UPI003688C655
MSTPAAPRARGGQAPRRRVPVRWIAAALAVALLTAVGLSTQYRSAESVAAAGPRRFDPAAYGARMYDDRVVPAVERKAVELPVLVKAMHTGMEEAGKRYGVRHGTGPYTFAVKGTGRAGPVTSGLMHVTVPGLPPDTRVSLQVGSVINGTALRDVVGFINFGQFLNQVEYADAATALNDQMREKLLGNLDVARLEGKEISFVGAFSFLTPSVVTITPVSIKEIS